MLTDTNLNEIKKRLKGNTSKELKDYLTSVGVKYIEYSVAAMSEGHYRLSGNVPMNGNGYTLHVSSAPLGSMTLTVNDRVQGHISFPVVFVE